ncbi:MAG: hypothetical protein NC453_06505 [Muribaculum sp.]|nr:hypothetical protein [Muribaculum sp.]
MNKEISNPYDNSSAHELLKQIMFKQQRITVTFKLDEYGFFAVDIESRTVEKFSYQISGQALIALVNYIYQGTLELNDVNPLEPLFEDGDNKSNEVNKQVLKILLDNDYLPHIRPAFIDNPGRLTATFKGATGSIILHMNRDEETAQWLAEHNLLS